MGGVFRQDPGQSSRGSSISKEDDGFGIHPDEAARASGRKGYVLLQASRGPFGILVALWTAAVVKVAVGDSSCHDFQGHSSGRDGEPCTHDDLWEEEAWQA